MSGNTDCSGLPQGRYECINQTGKCQPNPKGWYKSCEECNEDCEKYWSCVNGNCVNDGMGVYKTRDECMNGGPNGKPAPCGGGGSGNKYDCDPRPGGLGCHVDNYNGPYSSRDDCMQKSACGGKPSGKCSSYPDCYSFSSSGGCVKDPNGPYSSMPSCQNANPTKKKFNMATLLLIIAIIIILAIISLVVYIYFFKPNPGSPSFKFRSRRRMGRY